MARQRPSSSSRRRALIAAMAGSRGRLLATLVLLLIFCLGNARSSTAAQTEPISPVISSAVIVSETQPNTIVVSGTGFTPGGHVFIAIHSQWGMFQPETHWVTASANSYQPLQALAPGEGFRFDSGGSIGEYFEIPLVTRQPSTMVGVDCAASLLVMAYDRSTATWSNTATVDVGC